jgi:hypothetical protein
MNFGHCILEVNVRYLRQAEVAIGHRFWRAFRTPLGWLPSRQKHSALRCLAVQLTPGTAGRRSKRILYDQRGYPY